MKRRSLSASLGSWRVQLAYDPGARAPAEVAPPGAMPAPAPGLALALLPAFGAAGLSVVAASLALAHFLGLAGAARVLLLLLGAAFSISYGARCAPPNWSRAFRAARWPLAIVLALCALSLGWSEPFASLSRGEPNVQAAAFIGFVTLLSVLLIGSRSGGRIVPVAAPLVPGLSLFGLLCLVSVDGATQTYFLVWAGAALYVLCYDRFLRRVAPDLSSGLPHLSVERAIRRGDTPAWALQSVLVSSVWFALFLGGGALVYWPIQAVLPNLASFSWSRAPATESAKSLDYRGNAPVMELRGGSHALSDKPTLRVTVEQGVASGLWRGRVYEKYERSLWSERSELGELSVRENFGQQPFRLTRPRPLDPLLPVVPQLSARQGQVERVRELVEPLGDSSNLVYSSGQPLAWRESPGDFDYADPDRATEMTRPHAPYRVRSFVTRPNLRHLSDAPGYDPRAPDRALSTEFNADLRLNLELPADPTLRVRLQSIALQIQKNRAPLRTPDQKIRAIDAYLSRQCLYSLNAPEVPPTQDATIFFLTQSRQGACDMFASSMALLARQMGVPTRVVTGYLDSADAATQTETAGFTTYTLRERDAHAWVEYYVPRYGWLSFDPTQNTREAEPSLPGQIAKMLDLSGLHLPPTLLILPVAGIALIFAGLVWQRRSPTNGAEETERQRIETTYAQAVRALRARVPHAPTLTPGEYEARVTRAPLSATAKQEFSALTHLYLAARYGPAPAASRAQIEACLARLKKALREK